MSYYCYYSFILNNFTINTLNIYQNTKFHDPTLIGASFESISKV
jgi:hypothetical protein